MASIKDLDNPLLVLILNRLCIQKLFTAGHVCVRWNAMRDMSVSERKELLLMVGNDAKRYIDESELRIPNRRLLVNENGDVMFPENDQNDNFQISSFPLDFVRLLLTQFTNLTTLTISSRVNEHINSIIHLLEQFNRPNGSLHTLKLYSTQDDQYTKSNDNQFHTNERLLAALNSIGSLRKLSFDVNTINCRNLPILSHLEELEFNSKGAFDHFENSISRHVVNNPRLRNIGFNNITATFTWLLDLPTECASRFTQLRFFLMRNPDDHFENLCRHVVHLTSLGIHFERDHFTISTLFRPLTHLTNLISLKLYTNGYTIKGSAVPPNERGIMHFELPSVKVFTIDITFITHSHNFFHHCNMNRLFPNVQVVRVIRKIRSAICDECFWKLYNVNPSIDVNALEEHCTRYMFRHFTHSQHLRMVCSKVVADEAVGPLYRQWMWNEMEPFEDEED